MVPIYKGQNTTRRHNAPKVSTPRAEVWYSGSGNQLIVMKQVANNPVIAELERIAAQVRADCVRAVYNAKGGHLGGPLSCADILVALYFRVMKVRADEPDWPDRDRFILSKGHSSIALYATMAARGYFPWDELMTFVAIDSML